MKSHAPLNLAFHSKKQATTRSRWPIFVFASTITIVLSLLCIVQARQLLVLYATKQEYTTLKKYTEEQKQKITRKKALTKKRTALQDKLTPITTHYRALLTMLLKELAQTIPDSVRIDTLETDFTQKAIALTGHALNSEGITTFVRALSSKPLFKTLTLTGIDKHPHHFYCTFSLQATL